MNNSLNTKIVKNILCVPISIPNKDYAYGVLEICNNQQRNFVDQDINSLKPFICLYSLLLTYYVF